jgi:hypothetical protein
MGRSQLWEEGMRIYLGGPMFVQAEVEYNFRLAAKLRDLGFDVYCPNESEPINDKSRSDITPRKVYQFDIAELEASNVLLCQVSEDSGTNWEAGYMDCLSRHVNPDRYYGVLGLATDIRLQSPPDPAQAGVENMAVALNALVVGGLQASLGIHTDEPSAFARLVEIRADREQST